MTMEENYDQKKRRLFGRQKMSYHLSEIQKMLSVPVDQNKMLSIPASDLFLIRKRQTISDKPYFYMTIRFEDRSRFITKVIQENMVAEAPFYLWSPSSNMCGLYLIDSIHFINDSFPWSGEDIFSFTSVDLQEELVLSWYEENEKELLDIMLFSDSKRYVRIIQKKPYITPGSEGIG